ARRRSTSASSLSVKGVGIGVRTPDRFIGPIVDRDLEEWPPTSDDRKLILSSALESQIQAEHYKKHRRRRAQEPRKIDKCPHVRCVAQHRPPTRNRLGKPEPYVRQRRLAHDECRHQHGPLGGDEPPRGGEKRPAEKPGVARTERCRRNRVFLMSFGPDDAPHPARHKWCT